MGSKLCFDDLYRKRFKNDLEQIYDLYFERIQPAFAEPEKEANEHSNQLWESFMNQPCSEDEAGDPSDFADVAIDAGVEKYEILSLMKYRNTGMWISCLCQVWEQQLIAFVLNEARLDGVEYSLKEISRGFEFAKEIFSAHQIEFEDLRCWTKIKELRLLVNVLKHAEGYSEKKLRKIRPDFFLYETGSDNYDRVAMYHTTLLDETLHITDDDLSNYYKALIDFWDELSASTDTT